MSIQPRGNKQTFISVCHTLLPTSECGKQKKKKYCNTGVPINVSMAVFEVTITQTQSSVAGSVTFVQAHWLTIN
jgi:hypothetical protein